MASFTATQEAFWLNTPLKELGVNIKECISLSEHPSNHRNSKHIDYPHRFGREGFRRGDMKIVYVETLKKIADSLTEAMDPEKFIMFRDVLVVSRLLLKIIKTEK